MYDPPDFYDLDMLLEPAERALRDRARAWVEKRFLPDAARHWWDGTFPFELAGELADLQAFGGTGLSSVAYGLLMQELERGDSGLRTFASVQGALCMTAVRRFGSEDQKSHWLPLLARAERLACFALTEPAHGSNPGGMETTARRSGAGYALDGEKMWIGNATVAHVAVVWAKLDGEVHGFLVDTSQPAWHAELIEGKHSMRASLTGRIRLNGCAGHLLPGSAGLKAPLTCLNQARFSIAWGVLGAAMACYDEARRYALEREQFGRPIGSFQLVQEKLARMLTEITKAQLLAFRLAKLKDAGQATPARVSMAKRANVECALEVARTTRELLGGVGILDRFHCFRHMCNLESVKTYEGTQDMHTLILGREITGIPAFAP